MEQVVASSQQSFRKAILWLRAQRGEIIELYERAMFSLRPHYYKALPAEQQYNLVALSLDGLSQRLQSSPLDFARIKVFYLSLLEQEVTLETIVEALDTLTSVFIAKVRVDFASQPLVCDTLIQKANYYFNLIKVNVAAAKVEYESSREIK